MAARYCHSQDACNTKTSLLSPSYTRQGRPPQLWPDAIPAASCLSPPLTLQNQSSSPAASMSGQNSSGTTRHCCTHSNSCTHTHMCSHAMSHAFMLKTCTAASLHAQADARNQHNILSPTPPPGNVSTAPSWLCLPRPRHPPRPRPRQWLGA